MVVLAGHARQQLRGLTIFARRNQGTVASVLWNAAEILHCMGGVRVLFPLFAQLNLRNPCVRACVRADVACAQSDLRCDVLPRVCVFVLTYFLCLRVLLFVLRIRRWLGLRFRRYTPRDHPNVVYHPCCCTQST